jgi:RNase P/RNase MRP subunit p29
MITDEQLDLYRLNGIKVRVVRDSEPANDVRGIIVAWDDETVMVRKSNRNIVKLSRTYKYQPTDQDRNAPE